MARRAAHECLLRFENRLAIFALDLDLLSALRDFLLAVLVSLAARPNAPDDAATVRALRSGDVRAFEALYTTHYEAVWGVCFAFVRDRAEADDLGQDVFAWLWEHRKSVTIGDSWRAYLLRAARNRAFNYLRHRRVVRNSRMAWPDAHRVAGVGSGPGDASARVLVREVASAIQRAIDSLPERQRLAYALRVQNGCTTAETAYLMGITEKGVDISLGRAVKALRHALREYR